MTKKQIEYELEKIWIVLNRHTEELDKLRTEKKGDDGEG